MTSASQITKCFFALAEQRAAFLSIKVQMVGKELFPDFGRNESMAHANQP